MRLSDIMSHMALSGYAEIALVLFLLSFATIAAFIFANRNSEEWERCRYLPLDASSDGERATTARHTHPEASTSKTLAP
jgi:hypothetical protein